jgi:hypothetical protein
MVCGPGSQLLPVRVIVPPGATVFAEKATDAGALESRLKELAE